MLSFTHDHPFLKKPINARLGDHILGITLPGKIEAVFFRNNIKSFICSSSSHDATAVLLNLHGEKNWEISLADDDIIEKTAHQFRKEGLNPLADLIVRSKESLISAEIGITSYWKEYFESALLEKASASGLFNTDSQKDAVNLAISRHSPSRYKKTTCPTAINFIDNIWPDFYSNIRASLV